MGPIIILCYSLQSDNQFIGYPDTLRFMMGDGIPTLPNTALFSSTILCPDAAVTRSTLYYTSVLCLYPVAMTSVNTHAPFFVTIRTQIDAFDNWNTLVNDYSGFDFDWTANNCS
ncbi:hypothetical protein Hamer_G007096 [Homarus americanus]|uniref:Uncharacterized protein n=1 Tax=Homarus americanus TaxID=6706 RepID=A0A8J5K0L5_HOMAM|nr:hypothetical protein Hamer_G007096 [Homarus americanus]